MKKDRNKQAGRFYFILVIFCFFNSCKKEKKDDINILFWKKNILEDCIIKFNKNENNLILFDGNLKGEKYLIGDLELKKNVVFFNSKNFKNVKFPLFDFNLLKNECLEINYSKDKQVKKKYFLCNQDIFYDKSRNQVIYKFCFKNYNFLNTNTSVVFFVSKKNGILGWYLIDYSNNDRKISISEKMIGEVYNERYHYENFERFTLK